MKEEMKSTQPYYLTFHLPTGEVFQQVESMATQMHREEHHYEVGLKFHNLQENYKKSIYSCLIDFLDDVSLGDETSSGEMK